MAQDSAGRQTTFKSLSLPAKVKTYPTLNIAFYHASDGSAMGRILYLMRGCDLASFDSRGWLEAAQIRSLFTDVASPWQLYTTWRRVRQILSKGERMGIWHRDPKKRLWMHSISGIARELGCERLRSRPVYIPTAALLGSIKLVRAHFYASVESGLPAPHPISRAALAEMTGIPARTQRGYDELLERRRQINVAVTDIPYTTENVQEFAWKRGHNVFPFKDKKGLRNGKPGQSYIAFELPSTREAIHEQARFGRQWKYNDRINLVIKPVKPMQGHGVDVVAYHRDSIGAVKAFNRDPEKGHYYPEGEDRLSDPDEPFPLRRVQMWRALLL